MSLPMVSMASFLPEQGSVKAHRIWRECSRSDGLFGYFPLASGGGHHQLSPPRAEPRREGADEPEVADGIRADGLLACRIWRERIETKSCSRRTCPTRPPGLLSALPQAFTAQQRGDVCTEVVDHAAQQGPRKAHRRSRSDVLFEYFPPASGGGHHQLPPPRAEPRREGADKPEVTSGIRTDGLPTHRIWRERVETKFLSSTRLPSFLPLSILAKTSFFL